MRYNPVLTIAGSDPSGGAGIQADIKTISALGCYATTAITAVTVQNTMGVTGIHSVPADIVVGQIRSVMYDIRPMVVKVGMLNDVATIHAVAEVLAGYCKKKTLRFLVVDPVMVSTSGSPLMQPDAVKVFCDELMPLATLLTPNVPEAEVLSGITITDKTSMDEAGDTLLATGLHAVLIKGGHLESDMTDRLYTSSCVREFATRIIDTRNTHGTGCTYSSAIASYLARGCTLEDAITKAKSYITQAIASGSRMELGHGNGPVNHFYKLQRNL